MKFKMFKVLLAAAALLAFTPVMAQAAPDPSCVATLIDSSNAHWDLSVNGSAATGAVVDGGIDTNGDGTVDRGDAYDTWPFFSVSLDGSTWDKYDAGTAACTPAQGGREIVFPPVTVDGLSLSRRVYVPATGTPFARFVNVVSNPTGAPITVDVDLGSTPSDFGDLGSDTSTVVFTSSSGDTRADFQDSWATTWDGSLDTGGAPDGDPALGHLWQSALTLTPPDRSEGVVAHDTSDLFDEVFNRVTVAPGQTLLYVNYETQQATPGTASTVAGALAGEPADLFVGMSDADRAATQNFCAGDCDRDGRTDGTDGTAVADNCPSVPNADQADLDGDGKGDACDDDIDGDGLSNVGEAAIKTDPRKADTDGDGVKDGADACPTVIGKGANGCPRFDDATPPKVVLSGLKKSIKRKSLSKGIKAKLTCDEACASDAKVFGARKGARIAKAGDVELGSKKLALGTGTRSFTVKISKSLAKAVRKGAKLRLVITVTDASHNATVVTRTVRVK